MTSQELNPQGYAIQWTETDYYWVIIICIWFIIYALFKKNP